MLFTSAFTATAFAALAKSAAIARADACTIEQVGFFGVFNANLSINANQELIIGNSKPLFAAYEKCPSAPQNVDFASTGRIVAQLAGESTAQCLTIVNGTATAGPYTAKLETCTSDSDPSSAQLWGYGNDFGNVIFSLGTAQCGTDGVAGGAGFNNDQGPDGSLALIGCPDTESYESFDIDSTNNS